MGKKLNGEGSGGPPIHISGYATEKWPVQSENRDDVPVMLLLVRAVGTAQCG